jgi:hypothetical protein
MLYDKVTVTPLQLLTLKMPVITHSAPHYVIRSTTILLAEDSGLL